MIFPVTTKSAFSQRLPAVVILAYENERISGPVAFRNMLRRIGSKEFKGADRQLLMLHTTGKLAPRRILLVGLGKREAFTLDTLRRAMGVAAKKLRDAGIEIAAVQIRDDLAGGDTALNCVRAVVEATILGTYKFRQFKPDENNTIELRSLTVCLPEGVPPITVEPVITTAQISAEAANYAREIGNLPGNVAFPSVLADYACALAKEHNLKSTALAKKELEKRGFGGLLAVGGGSSHEPHLIALEYTGSANPSDRPIAIVGKAITFDSGGISIKPGDKMDEMKFDKCGGVAVLGTLRAIAQLKLPVNVIGVIAAAENLPSATSYRPGDIVTSYKGAGKRAVTIEVLNTDAEGRIVLGDALAYAREQNARAIIDLATLTGACVVALGSYAAGVMGNNEELIGAVCAAAEKTGERVWPLPLWQEYKDKIKSDVADIKNTGGREGGASTAAAFLAKYVGDTPWVHIDIAGTAWTMEERPYYAKGATGYGVRLLGELLANGKLP